MSITTIIIWTVVASLVVSGQTQNNPGNKFTLNEYYGLWYVVRIMTPIPLGTWYPIVCPAVHVRDRGYRSYQFQQSDTQYRRDGTIETTRSVRGEIRNSEIHLLINHDYNDLVMNVTSFNNGRELMILGSENRLISRVRGASAEARVTFSRIAKQANMFVLLPDNDNCA